jgi:hypothetical protein
MEITADVAGGKPIAAKSQIVSGDKVLILII